MRNKKRGEIFNTGVFTFIILTMQINQISYSSCLLMGNNKIRDCLERRRRRRRRRKIINSCGKMEKFNELISLFFIIFPSVLYEKKK